MSIKKMFKDSIFDQNPVLVQMLALCPALAVTSSLQNGAGLGLATTAVLIGSNSAVSLVKKFIPSNVRIPCYIVIIASFVTLIQLLLAAYVPALYQALGIFIPLIVANCVVLARAESFASKNPLGLSILDAIAMGIGFTFALSLIDTVREILGAGTILGFQILPDAVPRTLIFILPPGAFFTLAFIVAFIAYRSNKALAKEES